MKASLSKTRAGQLIEYDLKLKNLGPAEQPFTVTDAIPAQATYVAGGSYDASSGAVQWKGTVGPNRVVVLHLLLMVKRGTPSHTVVTNTAILQDDASGGSASTSTMVK